VKKPALRVLSNRRKLNRKAMTSDEVFLHEEKLIAVSPEGHSACVPMAALFDKLFAPRIDTGELLLTTGARAARSRGQTTIVVLERPPALYSFKWIASDSKSRFGSGTTYREVTLALPFLVVLAVFATGETGQFTLASGSNECFFRNAPLKSLDDELFYPALLNCSKFRVQEGRPLVWICTQYLDRSFDRERDLNARVRGGITALMRCLLETGFNYSSEAHEGSSWFTESRGVDPRIATVEAWQEASLKDRCFALDMPWLKTGHTLRQVMERIFKNLPATEPAIRSTADLARLVFNHNRSA